MRPTSPVDNFRDNLRTAISFFHSGTSLPLLASAATKLHSDPTSDALGAPSPVEMLESVDDNRPMSSL
jgi:hypothetical protein